MIEQYDVFISYRRSDGSKAARRLRQRIQDYRLPKSLRGPAVKPLKVYIDTVYERATNDFFNQTTLPALLASRHLAVVLTPEAVDRGPDKTDWIRREIAEFEKGPNAGNVIAIRAAGPFDGPLPTEIALHYPHIEIIDLRSAGPFSFLVPTRAARLAEETAKLVAPLLGVGPEHMPALRREEERRQHTRLGIAVGSAAALLVTVSALSVVAFESRNRAVDALSRSLFSADRLIEATATSMEGGERRSRFLMTACDLLDSLRAEADQEASTGAQVDCSIERAESRDALGEHKEVDALINNALQLTQKRFEATRDADDGMAFIRIAQTSFDRILQRDLAVAKGSPLTEFIARAKSVVDNLPGESDPPKKAADTLQIAAVTFGNAKKFEAALLAADTASSFRTTAASRRPSAATTIEGAAILGLKAHLHFALGQQTKGVAALERAHELLAPIDSKTLSEDTAARLKQILGLNDQIAAEGKTAVAP